MLLPVRQPELDGLAPAPDDELDVSGCPNQREAVVRLIVHLDAKYEAPAKCEMYTRPLRGRREAQPRGFCCEARHTCCRGSEADGGHRAGSFVHGVVGIVHASVRIGVSEDVRCVRDDRQALLPPAIEPLPAWEHVVPRVGRFAPAVRVVRLQALRIHPHHRVIPHIHIPVHPIPDGVL